MKDTLVLLTARAEHAILMERVRGLGEVSESGRFTYIDTERCRFGIVESDSLMEEFEPEELEEAHSRIGEFHTLLVEYPDLECAKSFLRTTVHDLTGILDTNYGSLLDYADALARMADEDTWDFRA